MKKPDDDGTNRRTRSSATAAGAAFAVFAGVTNATAARARRATAQSSTKKRWLHGVAASGPFPGHNQSAIGQLVQFFNRELSNSGARGSRSAELAYGMHTYAVPTFSGT